MYKKCTCITPEVNGVRRRKGTKREKNKVKKVREQELNMLRVEKEWKEGKRMPQFRHKDCSSTTSNRDNFTQIS